MSYGFHIDALRCIGCRACVDACCVQCRVPNDLSCRTVASYEGGVWEEGEDGTSSLTLFAYFISLSCLHCAAPACRDACSFGAVRKDRLTGLVSVAAALCTGCGSCVDACPYDMVRIDPLRHVALVCDACADVVGEGGAPACVAACPEDALHFGEVDALRARYGSVASIPPLPPAALTHPSVVLTVPPALVRALR